MADLTKFEVSRDKVMRLLYVNWKGEVEWRHVVPLNKPPEFGSPYHPDEWCFRVWDVDKRAERTYAYGGILWSGPLNRRPPSHLTMTYKGMHEPALPEPMLSPDA